MRRCLPAFRAAAAAAGASGHTEVLNPFTRRPVKPNSTVAKAMTKCGFKVDDGNAFLWRIADGAHVAALLRGDRQAASNPARKVCDELRKIRNVLGDAGDDGKPTVNTHVIQFFLDRCQIGTRNSETELPAKLKADVDPQDICNPHKVLPVPKKAKETQAQWEERRQKFQMFDRAGVPASQLSKL